MLANLVATIEAAIRMEWLSEQVLFPPVFARRSIFPRGRSVPGRGGHQACWPGLRDLWMLAPLPQCVMSSEDSSTMFVSKFANCLGYQSVNLLRRLFGVATAASEILGA
jgi:hypothetical protein